LVEQGALAHPQQPQRTATQGEDHQSPNCVAKQAEGMDVYIGYRQQVFMLRHEPEQAHDQGTHTGEAQAGGEAREAGVGHTIRVLEQRVADDGQGQP
jgi:hypothetical protein